MVIKTVGHRYDVTAEVVGMIGTKRKRI